MRDPLTVWREYQKCKYWRENMLMACLAAASSAVMIRYVAPLWAVVLPAESLAAESMQALGDMGPLKFGWTVAVAGVGGFTSFLHEVKVDPTKLRLLNGIGHMTAAHFAGLLMYFLALEFGFSTPWAYFACGIAGWGGNKTVQTLNDKFFQRVGVDMERKP